MNSMIKDIALAPTGHQKIAWVKEHMPLLNILNERYAEKKIFCAMVFKIFSELHK